MVGLECGCLVVFCEGRGVSGFRPCSTNLTGTVFRMSAQCMSIGLVFIGWLTNCFCVIFVNCYFIDVNVLIVYFICYCTKRLFIDSDIVNI